MISESLAAEPALRAALAVGSLGFLVTTIFLGQAVLLRSLRLRRQAQQARQADLWRPLLCQAACGEDLHLQRAEDAQMPTLLLLWNQMQDGLRGNAHAALCRLAQSLGLHAYARQALARPRSPDKVLSLCALAHLADPADWGQVLPELEARCALTSTVAARALLRMDRHRAVPLVIAAFLRRPDWPAIRLGALLREAADVDLKDALQARAGHSTAQEAERLGPLASSAGMANNPGLIEQVLNSRQESSVLAATLAHVRTPEALPRVRELCMHPMPSVRAGAAQALGRMGNDHDHARLLHMMADEAWWVRYRAGQSLLQLPGAEAAVAALRQQRLPDRYARDMLAHVLAEREQ